MRNKLGIIFTSATIAVVSGCATKAADVQSSYVSSSTYARLTCRQIVAEKEAIAGEVSRVSHAQNEQRKKDQIATGVGIVVFWPALIYNAAVGDERENLSRLKGEYEALDRAASEKGCRIQATR